MIDALHAMAKPNPVIGDVHDIRLRRTAAGLVCNYHCFASGVLSIVEVHDHVDAFEREVRLRFPEIIRVVGHAEPRQTSG